MGEHNDCINNIYDGELNNEELERLKSVPISESKIEQIKNFLEQNKKLLSGFEDIVGDDQIPTKQFF